MKTRVGIDLGGTKTEVAVLDASGRLLLRERRPTPRGDYRSALDLIRALVGEADRRTGGPCPVGVGIPGSESPATGLIRNANSTWLNGRPLHADLEELLARPVRLANDANCFALSEAVDGAGRGAESVFGVIAGTGTGAGIVIDGKVLTGINRVAGEWGHNPLPWPEPHELPGPACYCGRHGCLETWLSGPGLAADHRRTTGTGLTAEAIAARAVSGDPDCRTTLDRHAGRMARGLAHVINILDPEIIVLGGGLSNLAHLYEEVPRRWESWIFSDTVRTRLLPPLHGDSSGVRGAAWLWNE